LLSGIGTRLDRSAAAKTLRTLTTALGLRTDTVHPHAHELRHSFAVSTLTEWQRSGAQVDERIAVLSTYLGYYVGDPVKGSPVARAADGSVGERDGA